MQRNQKTYICGDGGAVETGVSVRAVPTPPLGGCEDLGESECKSLPSARLTTVFGGIRVPSFPDPDVILFCSTSGAVADVMIADRAILECCAIPNRGSLDVFVLCKVDTALSELQRP
jgi:hypothetical protein